MMKSRKDLLGDVNRAVIKIGTSSITMNEHDSTSFMDSIAAQVKYLKSLGMEILIVTSGAVGMGLKVMKIKSKPKDIPTKQAIASIGQIALIEEWNKSFNKQGLYAAQILVKLDDCFDLETVVDMNNMIDVLLENDAVPIINENDALCVRKISPMFGNNDALSAIIANRTNADLLVVISDVAGLYDKNPKIYPDAKLIPTVTEINKDVINAAGGVTSHVGTGGMKTKIKAAEICRKTGCKMIIVSNNINNMLVKAITGEDIGTIFIPDMHQ